MPVSTNKSRITHWKKFIFTAHDCEVNFVEFTEEIVNNKAKPKPQKVIVQGNPIINGFFLKDTCYVGCGYDNVPLIFKKQGDKWSFTGSLDKGFGKTKASKIGKDAFGGATVFFEGLELDENVAMKPKDTLH